MLRNINGEFAKRSSIYTLLGFILKLSLLMWFHRSVMEAFSAQGLLLDVEFCLDQILRQKELSIEVIGADYMLVGDRMWLMEALLNVVKNARKIAPGAEIQVLLHQMPFSKALRLKIVARDSTLSSKNGFSNAL